MPPSQEFSYPSEFELGMFEVVFSKHHYLINLEGNVSSFLDKFCSQTSKLPQFTPSPEIFCCKGFAIDRHLAERQIISHSCLVIKRKWREESSVNQEGGSYYVSFSFITLRLREEGTFIGPLGAVTEDGLHMGEL